MDDTQKNPLLQVENLHVKFPISGSRKSLLSRKTPTFIHALNGINFSIHKGETLGLVGESGCGKSTTAHAIVQLYHASQGHMYYDGQDISTRSKKEAIAIRKNIQMVFQDPYSSLNPRMTVRAILAEPLHIYIKHGVVKMNEHEIETRINDMLTHVGLSVDAKYRYPHNFSGGQRQRINIARALMLEPKVMLADEVTSALDVSIQAQIINLLKDLQKNLGLALLFISHDLAVVQHISHKVAIMYCGKIVEMDKASNLYKNPLHPYTQALLSAVNMPDPVVEKKRSRILLSGNVPSLTTAPCGCPFYERCQHAMPKCKTHNPQLLPKDAKTNSQHEVACFLYS